MNEQKEREGNIDQFYRQPIGSRRLKILKLRSKLREKKSKLSKKIYYKYKESFDAINVNHELDISNFIRQLNKQGYFDLLSRSQSECNRLDKSPLTRILYNDFSELYGRSNHKNMLDASNSIFRNDSDPVLSTVLNDEIYKLNVPGNTRRERKKARHKSDIYRRRLEKHVYERYLSEAVGRHTTVEEYEKEFEFLSGVKNLKE